jgi:hypothetical protein
VRRTALLRNAGPLHIAGKLRESAGESNKEIALLSRKKGRKKQRARQRAAIISLMFASAQTQAATMGILRADRVRGTMWPAGRRREANAPPDQP